MIHFGAVVVSGRAHTLIAVVLFCPNVPSLYVEGVTGGAESQPSYCAAGTRPVEV